MKRKITVERNKELIKHVKQVKKMELLFKKLSFTKMEDWMSTSKLNIIRNGGRRLLEKYSFNLPLLLKTIYPNYPWNEEILQKRVLKPRGVSPIDIQREKLEKIYKDLELTTLDDWLRITPSTIEQNGGKVLLKTYHYQLPNLLMALYPNYAWDFTFKINSLEHQRAHMDQLFVLLKLQSLSDWLNVPRYLIKKNGGEILLELYDNNMKTLLTAIYPNYCWSFLFSGKKEKYCVGSLKSIDNQRAKMDYLFYKLRLKSLDSWLQINPSTIARMGGDWLLKKYQNDLKTLLLSLYPHFAWDFSSELNHINRKKFKSLKRQRAFFDQLFAVLNFSYLDDFLRVSLRKVILYGGWSILKHYNDNMKELLPALYPNYPWKFAPKSQKLPKKHKYKLFVEKRIKAFMKEYYITQKHDWYRVSCSNLKKLLLFHFPTEKWKSSSMMSKTKKSTQRVLFARTQQIYPSLLIYEDYFHPKLFHHSNFELDLFIPALQLALEYQGQQHYDDIPSTFAGVDSCQFRDQIKGKIASELLITIISIPYWWDQSLSTLRSVLQSH